MNTRTRTKTGHPVCEVVWVPPDADVEEVGGIRTAPEEGLTVHRASDPRARRGGGH